MTTLPLSSAGAEVTSQVAMTDPVDLPVLPKSLLRDIAKTPELQFMILQHLEIRDIAVMMRVAKIWTTGAAEQLYREVDMDMAKKLNRKTKRRIVLCDAVQILNSSPIPLTHGAKLELKHTIPKDSVRRPRQFDLTEIRSQVIGRRKKFGGLECLVDLYPGVLGDDGFAVKLSWDKGIIISIQLETTIFLDTRKTPFLPPVFPPSQTFGDIPTTHAFIVALDDFSGWNSCVTLADKTAHLRTVRDWLYLNPSLDRRVVGIRHLDATRFLNWPSLTITEATAFGLARQNNCEPLTSFDIDPQSSIIPLDQFETLLNALGPAIRTIQLDSSTYGGVNSSKSAFDLLDRKFPALQECTIKFERGQGIEMAAMEPISGCRRLRRLAIQGLQWAEDKDVISWLCQLGTSSTVFQRRDVQVNKDTRVFHLAVLAEQKDQIRRSRTQMPAAAEVEVQVGDAAVEEVDAVERA